MIPLALEHPLLPPPALALTFASWPVAAIAAAILIPALIILYFLKLRRRDMEVSSTLLWKKAIQDLQANAPFQKLRNNILLLLQLLALAAGLFALAQPEFRDQANLAQRQIILIDRSASMQATDGDAAPSSPPSASGLSRLDAAKKKALEIIDALREPSTFSFDAKPEEAMVIAFDSSAQVLQGFTASKAALREAVNNIQPTDSPTLLVPAFELAKAFTGSKKFESQVVESRGFVPQSPGATLHILSDGRLPDAGNVRAADNDVVVYHTLGSPDAINIGITGLRAERAFDNPSKVNIFLGLISTDQTKRTVDVDLSIDGKLQTVRDVTISAATKPSGADAAPADDSAQDPAGAVAKTEIRPGRGGFVVPLIRPEGGVATVRLKTSGPNALAADDVAYLVIPPARRLSVVLVTSGNLLVQQAIEGLSLSTFDVKTPAEFQKLLDADQLGKYDVFVLDGVLPNVPPRTPPLSTTPLPSSATPKPTAGPSTTIAQPPSTTPRLAPGLPRGRSLVLGVVPPPPLGMTDLGDGEPDVFLDFDRNHPTLRFAALDKVNIFKARKVSVVDGTPVRTLARTKQGPAILEVTDSEATAILVPFFQQTNTDWVFDLGFIAFLVDSIRYLSDVQAANMADTLQPGDTLASRLPRGATDIQLSTPDTDPVSLEAAPDGTVSFAPISRAGVYTLTWKGPAAGSDLTVNGRALRALTANLLDPAESDIAARPSLSMARQIVDAKAQSTARLWPYFLLALLGIVMLEWWVYNRKVAI